MTNNDRQTMKNNAKSEVELTCHFKADRNLKYFESSTGESKKIAL